MMLADFGAEVTKVERPGSGDETRSWGPPYDERGEATYFQSVNRNKASVAIDMGTEAGLAELRRRAREADVLVENFRPGLMASKGLDFEALRAENPRLVYCSITGFGSGPGGAELPGYDLLVQALGGLMGITGDPDGEPMKVGVAAGRRAGRALRHGRDPHRAPPPRRHRRGPAGRGRPLLGAARGDGQPGRRLHDRRRRPRAARQPPPEHLPL